jgi:uncharacterized membrane protein
MKRLKVFSLLLLVLIVLVPGLTLAAGTGLQYPPQPNGLPNAGGGTATTLLLYVINVVLSVVGLISVAFLIYGGFQYVTSGGNDEQAEGGKKTIQNSIIGLVIVILSYVIIHVIISAVAFSIT